MVRNTYDFDCARPTSFWFVICDTFVDIDGFSTKMRNFLRKSLKTYDIQRVSADEILSVGLPIYQEANRSYRIKAPEITAEEFRYCIEYCVCHMDYCHVKGFVGWCFLCWLILQPYC